MSLKQSEPLLDVLRDFAREGKIAEISEACELYFFGDPTRGAEICRGSAFQYHFQSLPADGGRFRLSCVRKVAGSEFWLGRIDSR